MANCLHGRLRAAHDAVRFVLQRRPDSPYGGLLRRRYDKDPLFDIVDRALGKTPDLDMPVSPDDFGEITPRRTPMAPGAIAAQYPAAFQPRPQRKD